MPHQIRTAAGKRWATLSRLQPRLKGLAAMVVGTVLAGLGFWRDEFPNQWQPPFLADVLGVLPWWAWVLIWLAVVLIVLFEASHRELSRVDTRLADAEREIKGLQIARAADPESMRREHEAKLPVLEVLGPNKRMSEVDTNQLPLWFVTVRNNQPGSIARNVRVRMDHPDPKIVMWFPVDLHRMHDNDKPFKRIHDIRYGEAVTFDLFACGQLDPDMYYLYRADGDESSQVGPEWMLSEDDNSIISQASREPEGWRFDVIATPDPPALPAAAPFCLKRGGNETWPCLDRRGD